MKITRRQLQFLIQEEIRQVRPGCFKLYPKKPRKGEKRKKALSKKCKSKSAAQDQEAAIKASQNERRRRRRRKKDPRVGTGKKPPDSDRRLYTDEDPSDTVSVKFKTKSDIQDTLSKKSFKSKSHQRQSQIINLIHQRVRAAYKNAKDPEVKKRLKRAYDYAKDRKEASKRKTQRMRKKK